MDRAKQALVWGQMKAFMQIAGFDDTRDLFTHEDGEASAGEGTDDDEERDLRPPFLRGHGGDDPPAPPSDPAADNAARLAKGIKPLEGADAPGSYSVN